MESPLKKPERDDKVTERMIEKSRQVHQKDTTSRTIGCIVMIILIVAAACVAYYFLYGGGSITVTE